MMNNPDAQTYLDSSLEIDMNGLKEFFGEFDMVTAPPFGDYSVDVVALYDSKEHISKPNLYKIETNDGKVVNIIHLLTCY